MTPSMRKDNSFIRIHYVRYADDFVVGVEASYSIAKEILNKLESFVNEKLGLTFNQDKTGITKYYKHPVKFLGYTIRSPHTEGMIRPLETVKIKGKKITRRKKIRIRIEMDTEKVLKRLHKNGFIKKITAHSAHKNKIYSGTSKGNMINLDHDNILMYYNSVVRGIHNYYRFVKNQIAVA